jgi:dynein assembly factor 3
METQSSTLARHMILLSVLIDPALDSNLQERTELFLELYGNLLIREKTANSIKLHSSDLIRYYSKFTVEL